MAELRSTLATWEAGGFVQRLSAPLCQPHDGSCEIQRHNRFHEIPALEKSTIKLDDLSLVQELIEPEDYMTSLDLENQYFQVRL
jgi:hypothetical protein